MREALSSEGVPKAIGIMGSNQTAKGKLLRQQLAAVQQNIYSFAPDGIIENGNTMRRARGDKSDIECINEVCGLVAEGMKVVDAVKYVKLPWSTWHAWVQQNFLRTKDRYAVAYEMHLERMADETQRIYETLVEERRVCREKYYNAHREWRNWDEAEHGGKKRPLEPIYEGPTEWELNAAKLRVLGMHIHLKSGLDRFKDKTETTMNINDKRSLVHEVTIKKDETAEEALREYHKLIEGTKS
jgi:hypothetical protein